jgi:hypothetical protein
LFYKLASISGFITNGVASSTGVRALAHHPQAASTAEENIEKDIGKNGTGWLAAETARRTPDWPIHRLTVASMEVSGS